MTRIKIFLFLVLDSFRSSHNGSRLNHSDYQDPFSGKNQDIFRSSSTLWISVLFVKIMFATSFIQMQHHLLLFQRFSKCLFETWIDFWFIGSSFVSTRVSSWTCHFNVRCSAPCLSQRPSWLEVWCLGKLPKTYPGGGGPQSCNLRTPLIYLPNLYTPPKKSGFPLDPP